MTILDRDTLEAALIGYEHARNEIDAKIEQLRTHLLGHSASVVAPTGKRVRSAAVRKRMALAQQKRWAAKKNVAEAPIAPEPKTKRKATGKRAPLSPEARERIAAAQRKRWAAGKKTAKNK